MYSKLTLESYTATICSTKQYNGADNTDTPNRPNICASGKNEVTGDYQQPLLSNPSWMLVQQSCCCVQLHTMVQGAVAAPSTTFLDELAPLQMRPPSCAHAQCCFTYRDYSQRARRRIRGGGIIGSSQLLYGVDLSRNSLVSTSSL